jgi:hypothetical protein
MPGSAAGRGRLRPGALGDRGLEAGAGPLHVGGHGRDGRLAVAPLDRLEDRQVLPVGGAGLAGGLDHPADPDPQQGAHAVQHVVQDHVAGGLGHPQVEADVGLDEADRVVARRAHRLQQPAQVVEGLLVAALGGQPGHHHLEVLAGLDQVEGRPLAEQQAPLDHLRQQLGVGPLEVGAVALAHLEQAEQVQRLERLPDERPADAEGLGQAALGGDPLPGLDLPGQEVVEQPARDLHGEGLARAQVDSGEAGRHGVRIVRALARRSSG